MTDELSQTTSVISDSSTSASTPVSHETSAPAQTQSEKMLAQSHVDHIVKKAKADAYEKGRNEAMTTAQQPSNNSYQPSQMGGMQQLSEERIKQLIAEESKQKEDMYLRSQQEAQANEIAGQYLGKMAQGKDKYEDFENVTAALDVNKQPHLANIVLLANGVDNTADVMYELAKSPHKIASLLTLVHTAPLLAQQEMNRLSASIKNNESASNFRSPDEPLSQLRHSTTGTDNGSPMTVKDWRKKSYLRG